MIKTKTICLVLHKFSGGGEKVNLQSHKGKVASLQLSFPTTRLPPPLFPPKKWCNSTLKKWCNDTLHKDVHQKNGAMDLHRIC